ncbi:MAG: ATP-binding cassette domain-containing protein [Fusobacterium gastrosuis]|nr:ATP-binding cassette domain-containing protein [Fusobacterium gastrosuis]
MKDLFNEKSNEENMILETKNLTKIFTTYDGKDLVACNNINLKVYKGKTLGLVGESGSGKTTFIRMLMNLEKPSSGEILYHGRDVNKFSEKEIWENRQKIQMIFQDPWAAFNPKMNVLDILTEPLLNYKRIKKSDREKVAAKLLKMVELPEEYMYRYSQNMSGGQKQRLGIARAISLEPEILICDEATCALDVSIQKIIIELLVRLQKEKNISMVFICHDLALVQSFAHEIAVMNKGDIVEIIDGDKIQNASHPYTKKLIDSVFSIHMEPYKKK